MKVAKFHLLLFLLFAGYLRAEIIYVNQNAGGSNDGSSWTDAFTNLQLAIDAAVPGDEIWVAKGVYWPTKDQNGNPNPTDARLKVFFINKDIKLYGGFWGNEDFLEERDLEQNPTVLSGDIDQNDQNTDGNFIAEDYNQVIGSNTFRIVWLRDVSSDCVVDGFVITAGMLPGNGSYAGMLIRANQANTTPVIRNCRFHGHKAYWGAALSILGNNPYKADPTIEHCLFSGNWGTDRASGIFNFGWVNGSGPTFMTVRNCVFEDNIGNLGTAIFNHGGLAHGSAITNCVFRNNTSARGGAIFNYAGGNHQIINCTFVNNHASVGGGAIRMETSSPTLLKNCIFWGNTSPSGPNLSGALGAFTLSHCLLSDAGCPGSANCGDGMIYDQDPQFVSIPADLYLSSTSPAINAGSSEGAPADDLDNNVRPFPCTLVDMGAYEYQSSPSLITCYLDSDGDGFGNAAAPQDFCDTCAEGYVTDNTDCDDTDTQIYPGQVDLCDNIDNDCDGQIDEDLDPDPIASITNLIDLIGDLVDNGDLDPEFAVELIDKLNKAIIKLNDGMPHVAGTQLNAYYKKLDDWLKDEAIDLEIAIVLQRFGICLSNSIDNGDLLIVPEGSGLNNMLPPALSNATHNPTIMGKLDIKIFPNPTPGHLTLNLQNYLSQAISVSIFSAVGQEVYRMPEQVWSVPQLSIDLTARSLPDGLYFLSIQDQEGRLVKQFVLSR